MRQRNCEVYCEGYTCPAKCIFRQGRAGQGYLDEHLALIRSDSQVTVLRAVWHGVRDDGRSSLYEGTIHD